MINKNIFLLSTVLLVLCLGFGACDDCEDVTNPECRNYDPCWDQFETTADFTIYQAAFKDTFVDGRVYSIEIERFVGDTVLLNRNVFFEAFDEDTECTWASRNPQRFML